MERGFFYSMLYGDYKP